jgi:hypothetical protein
MLLGLFQSEVADQTIAVTLLETFQSRLFVVLVPGLLAFFIGTALAVVSLASPASPFRWPALALGLGAALILGEIILAQVLLSQIGNILILVAGIGFARLLRGQQESSSKPSESRFALRGMAPQFICSLGPYDLPGMRRRDGREPQ